MSSSDPNTKSLTVSVIIPTWNVEGLIYDAVKRAAAVGDEVIVSDGGSTDDTVTLARRAGARVCVGEKGRGVQLNHGGKNAQGEILLFLHADARLPAKAKDLIVEQVSEHRAVGGNFYVDFLPVSWFTRALAVANDVRRRIVGRYYGDSGIFVTRKVFHAMNGYRPWPLMEDYEFSKRLSTEGNVAYITQVRVIASTRRFSQERLRYLILWPSFQLLYLFGCSPYWLARHYPDVRSRRPEEFITEARANIERQQKSPVD
jgi:rSAM/selenodomain-associated transferase 2